MRGFPVIGYSTLPYSEALMMIVSGMTTISTVSYGKRGGMLSRPAAFPVFNPHKVALM
jgi:hypothetical protein